MTHAVLQIRRNTDAWQTGGVIGSVGDVITLGYAATDGVRAQSSFFELYGVPPGYALPSGWTDLGNGVWHYRVDGNSPTFTIDRWGKYMLCLRLNGAADEESHLVDFSTAISILGSDNREDVGKFETSQFHPEWSEGLRNTLRILGSGGGGGADATKLPLNGSVAMTADLPFGNHRGVNAADPSSPQDVVNLRTLNTAIAGITMDTIPPAFSIASFALSGTNYASVVEVGTTISSLTAAATYVSGPPSTASITDTASGSWTLSSPYASGSRSTSLNLSAVGTYTATLGATGPGGVRTRASSISSCARQYWGVGAAGLTAAQVQALGNSVVQPGLLQTFTVTASNQKIYSLTPVALGIPDWYYTGFEVMFLSPQTVNVTSNGITLSYYLLETTYPQNGTGMVIYLP